MLNELTVQKLKDMKPGEMFAMGVGFYPEIISLDIKWVAVRGVGYYDWTIYYLSPSDHTQEIVTNGDKMFTESVIRKLVPCSDDAYSLYRL